MQKKIFIFLLVLSVGLFLLDRAHFLNPVRRIADSAFVPLEYIFYSGRQKVTDEFRILTFWQSGEARIKYLETKNRELLEAKVKAESLAAENAALRKQLGILPAGKFILLPAAIIGADSAKIIIAAGTDSGVRPGQTVVIGETLLGVVDSATPKTSVVRRPTASGSKIPAKIGEVRGLIAGEFNTGMLLTQVAQTEPIDVGDTVETSGEGDVPIPNLLIGQITKIKSRESDVFREAQVVSPVNLSDLSFVFIVK